MTTLQLRGALPLSGRSKGQAEAEDQQCLCYLGRDKVGSLSPRGTVDPSTKDLRVVCTSAREGLWLSGKASALNAGGRRFNPQYLQIGMGMSPS